MMPDLNSPATEPTAPLPRRRPLLGDDIIFGGQPAKVITIHRPGDPDSPLNLVVHHGATPEVSVRVAHDADSGWCWPSEVPPPPPTLAEQIAAARAAGVRVPAVGETVLRIVPSAFPAIGGPACGSQRARVLAIKAIKGDRITLDLAVFRTEEPPEDARGPDPTDEVWSDQRGPVVASHGWAFPGWVSPPHEHPSGPKLPCTRCGDQLPHTQRIPIHAEAHFGRWNFFNSGPASTPLAVLCRPCTEVVFEFATSPPPDPAVVLPEDRASELPRSST